MKNYCSVQCGRCARPMETPFYDACPHCQADGVNVNYTTVLDVSKLRLPEKSNKFPGIYRFHNFFTIDAERPFVSINEGDTPLQHLKRLGKKLGLPNLYMKDESKNPTFSHKDRMCSLIVSKALQDGAPGVVISSTGNQGASTAAYCSAAGIPCVVFTTPNVSSTMKTLMQVYGASVFMTPTMGDRIVIMEKLVRELGFSPASGLMAPPIGSSPFGTDGYKTIAFEVFEQFGNRLPDWFFLPISYGDTLYGVYKGFLDLLAMGYINKLPRLAAAEVFGPLKATLDGNAEIPVAVKAAPSIQTSIACGNVAYLTVKAVRESKGVARISKDEEALAMQLTLARSEGVYSELSSVAALVILEKLLAEKVVKSSDSVVFLNTSTGIKDPEATQSVLPTVPQIQPTLEEFRTNMKKYYGSSF